MKQLTLTEADFNPRHPPPPHSMDVMILFRDGSIKSATYHANDERYYTAPNTLGWNKNGLDVIGWVPWPEVEQ